MAAVQRGFEESLWTLRQFRERFAPCNKEHCTFKERHSNSLATGFGES